MRLTRPVPQYGSGVLHRAQKRFPISIHSSGRYFVDALGAPFPIWGDSMWWGPQNLSTSDQSFYLLNRWLKGFTCTFLAIVEHNGCLNKPPKDFSGNLPFTQRLDGGSYTGSPNGSSSAGGNNAQFTADPYAGSGANTIANAAPDYTFPNAPYWTAIDAFLSYCLSLQIVVFIFPSYVGFAGGQQGWMAEMVALDAVTGAGGQAGQGFADGSKSKLWNYGAWLANRYKTFPNLVWIDGGDYGSGSTSGTFSAPEKAAVTSLLSGMRSVSGQASPLHVAHWSRPSLASDVALTGVSLDGESVYTDSTPADEMRSGYSHSPTQPTLQIEGRYEGAATGSAPWRKYNWWCVTSAGGYFYGNDGSGGMYSFLSGWQGNLDSQTALDMGRMHAFLRAITWWKLIPSGLGAMGTIVTANGSTSTSQDYISASAAGDGSLCVAYMPPAWASGTFTVDMTIMRGSATAQWFDPTSGAYSSVSGSPIANTGTHTFTPPGTNSGGDTDWLLLLQA